MKDRTVPNNPLSDLFEEWMLPILITPHRPHEALLACPIGLLASVVLETEDWHYGGGPGYFVYRDCPKCKRRRLQIVANWLPLNLPPPGAIMCECGGLIPLRGE